LRGIFRKFSSGSLIAALLFAASGCGAGGSEAATEGKKPEQVAAVFETPDFSAELSEKPEQKETAQADLSAYDEILERIYTMVSHPYEDYDDVPGETGVLETARSIGDSAPDMMGYLIKDISGDGIPELMVGAMPEYGAWVNAVYTLVEDKPRLVLEGWYRNQYSYGGNGIFYNTGSNGAAQSGIGTFSITQDGTALECQNFYFTDFDEASGSLRVCHNTTGSWEPAESEITDMSADDFWMMEVPASALELNPLSRFDLEDVSVRWLEEAARDCSGFVVKEKSTTEADPARIPVLTYGRLPFDDMEEVGAGDGNPDGGYAHEYRTGDGIATVYSRAFISRREESEKEGLTGNLEDYITECAEALTPYETRDTRAEKNETCSERLGWPVYIVQFTTGWNEDTRFWTVYGTEANGYIYLYAFDIWADADWEQEKVWEVFDELIFSD
jgi:hypothetical protein